MGHDIDRLKQILQQSATRTADAEMKAKHLLGVQQQVVAAKQEAASLNVSNISCASTLSLASSV